MSFELECITSGALQSPPPPPNLASLPQELLNQIFSHLSPNDLQAAACVSRIISRSVIAAARCNEFRAIKNFIQILLQKIPGQRERLAKIVQNITFQNFANLQLLKRAILDVKAQLINVIKTVDEETANGLHDVRPPHFLGNIFTLALLERQIDEAHLIPDEDDRWDALRDISKALRQAGDIDRSLEVAKSILDENKRGYALWGISQFLTRAGDIDKAIAVAQSISGKHKRGDALRSISQALAKAGNIDRSLEVATLIPNDFTKEVTLWTISQILTQAGKIDRAIIVAGLIPNEDTRWYVLWGISQALTQAGKVDRAIALATSIPDKDKRGKALRDIFKALTRAGDLERSLAVAKEIGIGNALWEICSLQ